MRRFPTPSLAAGASVAVAWLARRGGIERTSGAEWGMIFRVPGLVASPFLPSEKPARASDLACPHRAAGGSAGFPTGRGGPFGPKVNGGGGGSRASALTGPRAVGRFRPEGEACSRGRSRCARWAELGSAAVSSLFYFLFVIRGRKHYLSRRIASDRGAKTLSDSVY